MIIKIKTFSGDEYLISEENYLQELMYSEEEQQEKISEEPKKSSNRIKRTLGTAAATIAGSGAGYLLGRKKDIKLNNADIAKRLQELDELGNENVKFWNNAIKSSNSAEEMNNAKEGLEKCLKIVKEGKEEVKNFKPGKYYRCRNAAIGALAGAGLAYGGYKLYKHYKNKKKQQEENDNTEKQKI